MKNFIDFVNEQPTDREIYHETWNSCAVGDYLREVHGFHDEDLSRLHLNPIAVDLLGDDTSLFNVLNNGSTAKEELPTYGALQEFISDVVLPDDYTGLVSEENLDAQ